MNSTHTLPSFVARPPRAALPASPASVSDTLQSRFALRVASRLTEGCDTLPPSITERLRFAREQALLQARGARTQASAPSAASRPARETLLARWTTGWRLKFAGLVPVLALVGGLVLIEQWQDSTQIAVAAEIDAALLSDDLPPTAYSDAGFVEYLKTPAQ